MNNLFARTVCSSIIITIRMWSLQIFSFASPSFNSLNVERNSFFNIFQEDMTFSVAARLRLMKKVERRNEKRENFFKKEVKRLKNSSFNCEYK